MATNDVFVAFGQAADDRQLRFEDEISESGAAAGCERRGCKSDGYGVYTRNGVGFGFMLDMTAASNQLANAAKFHAFVRYRHSGHAAREPLPVPLTTTERISGHAVRESASFAGTP